jgi:hypothetical protein
VHCGGAPFLTGGAVFDVALLKAEDTGFNDDIPYLIELNKQYPDLHGGTQLPKGSHVYVGLASLLDE